MVKSLEGPTAGYVPGARVATAWIKLKKDYLAEGLADTIDVVPIAVCSQFLSRPRISELFQQPQPLQLTRRSLTLDWPMRRQAFNGQGRKAGWLSPFLCAV